MPSLPSVHRQVQLLTTPDGLPRPEDFTVVEVPVPPRASGEVLVRNRAFLVSAALLRTLIGARGGTARPATRSSPPPTPAACVRVSWSATTSAGASTRSSRSTGAVGSETRYRIRWLTCRRAGPRTRR